LKELPRKSILSAPVACEPRRRCCDGAKPVPQRSAIVKALCGKKDETPTMTPFRDKPGPAGKTNLHADSAITAGLPSIPLPPSAFVDTDKLRVSWHENEVPEFVEAELERLYGSLFSSLAHYRVYGGAENASCCVIRNGDDVTGILLFQRDARSVRVINEWIRLDEEDIRRFVSGIFERYPTVVRVTFHAVELDVQRLPFPGQLFNCTDDSVVRLPENSDAYLAQLGKATRKNIRRYLSRLQESFPDFRYEVYETDCIDERHVREIIGLNRLRMKNKNKVSGIDDEEAERMLRLLKTKGMVAVATIAGKLCAGAVTYRIGNNYFSFVRAHDPRYDDHRLGLIGGYLLIAECIARGGKEFHFMWGREEHKALLLGVQREFDHLTLYRSRAHYLLDARSLLKNAFDVRLQQLKRRLLTAQADANPAWRWAAQAARRMYRSGQPHA
jgi:hypothetical protein